MPDADPSASESASKNPSKTPSKRLWAGGAWAALGLGAVLLAATAFGLYEIARQGGKSAVFTGACAHSLNLAQAVDPLARGEVAALALATSPNDLRAVAFDDAEGRKTSVDGFAGRTILLNLWATWCAPCKEEMPALDKLQAALGSARFLVVPVNIDQARLERPRAFLAAIGATHLPFYSDASADILQAIRGKGLPTTVLIGPDGCEIGTMAGPASWESPDARALIERAIAPAAGHPA